MYKHHSIIEVKRRYVAKYTSPFVCGYAQIRQPGGKRIWCRKPRIQPEGVFIYVKRANSGVVNKKYKSKKVMGYLIVYLTTRVKGKLKQKLCYSFLFAVMPKCGSPGANGFGAENPVCAPKAYLHTSRGGKRG